MFIREKKGEYKGKTYVNYQLVESFRTPKGPRQRVVCSLGDLGPRPLADWLKLVHKIESALVGQAELFDEPDAETQSIVNKIKLRQAQKESNRPPMPAKREPDEVIGVLTGEVTTESDREAGPVHVAYQYWKKLGMDQILSDVGLHQRERKLTCLMTMNRVLAPCSEHAMPDWIRTTALGDILEDDFDTLTEDPLYRNLDALYSRRAAIEGRLADKERDLFNLD
jgi:hypothetical protein